MKDLRVNEFRRMRHPPELDLDHVHAWLLSHRNKVQATGCQNGVMILRGVPIQFLDRDFQCRNRLMQMNNPA
jgi:hypothetical protein